MKKFFVVLATVLISCIFASSVFAAADIVFLVDESGSMSTEHAWLDGMVTSMNTELAALGETDVTYSLVGFGNAYYGTYQVPHTLLDTGTVGEFTTATDSLQVYGGFEDGYAAIDYSLNNLNFTAGAAMNFILITDEDRDVTPIAPYTGITYASILEDLTDANALLNVVVDGTFSFEGQPLVGTGDEGYVADGLGGYTTTGAADSLSGYGTTITDYANLALATGGAAWDLNQLRAGGLTAESFTNAFVASKLRKYKSNKSQSLNHLLGYFWVPVSLVCHGTEEENQLKPFLNT